MPFNVQRARQASYPFEFVWGEQRLIGRYSAGEKYAKLEDKVNARALAAIKKGGGQEGETPKTLRQRKLEECELLSIVLEEWDAEGEDGKPVPLKPKAMVDMGLPLEFYTSLSSAIERDLASRRNGSGGKKS